MVLTRAQVSALKAELIPLQANPDAFAKKMKEQAAAQRAQDAKLAGQLDELADMFSAGVNVGQTPVDALTEALAKMGVGGRRKTRKNKGKKKSKKSKKTRKH